MLGFLAQAIAAEALGTYLPGSHHGGCCLGKLTTTQVVVQPHEEVNDPEVQSSTLIDSYRHRVVMSHMVSFNFPYKA